MTKLDITEQLTRLEMLFSEQEHTLQSLNDIVAQQTRQISNLSSDLQILKKQYRELSVTWEGAYGTSSQLEHANVIDGGSLADFESHVSSKFLEAKASIDGLIKGVDSEALLFKLKQEATHLTGLHSLRRRIIQ